MPTENHGLNTPTKGEENWDVPLNENAAALDTLVEIRDVESNRDEYAPKDGAKYLATDTGSVYLGDGDAWNVLGEIASTGTFDARNYDGEVGGDRIQAALDDAATAESAVVVVRGDGPDDVSDHPNATRSSAWLLRSALEVPSNTTLWFRGAHVFLDDGVDQNLVRNAAATSGDDARDVDIHVLGDRATFLNGNATRQNRPTTDEPQVEPGALEHFGILLYKVDRCSVSGFQIGRTAGWGVVVQDFTDCVMRDINFRQDAAVWNQDGCSFVGPGDRGHITGLTGTFGDDLATLYGSTFFLNDPVGPGGDLANISITNCQATAPSDGIPPTIRVQTGDRTTAKHVTIADHTLDGGHIKLANNNEPAHHSDLSNVSVNNIATEGGTSGVMIGGKVENVTVSNFHLANSTDVFLYADWNIGTSVSPSLRHATIENCMVETDAPLVYVGPNGGSLENITLRDVTNTTTNGGDGSAHILLENGKTTRNLTVENLTIDGGTTGEGIYAGSDHTLENVRVRNLHCSNVTNGVSIESNTIVPPVEFSDVTFENCSGSKFDISPDCVAVNGIGRESANADTPTAANWTPGDIVEFEDTADGSGDGVYMLLPGGNWSRIGEK